MYKHLTTAAFLLAILSPAPSLGDGTGHSHPISGPADAYVYELARPGTYALPVIRKAADAALLDETGAAVDLHQVFAGRITVLAFIYTRCADICPLASAGMADLQAMAAGSADAADLALVSLSFDPAHDSPARLAEYAETFRTTDAPPWLFLTARDVPVIAPVIQAYGQPVNTRAAGSPGGPFSHLLRVFLVDADGMIRNIYSADFLDPRLVLNDIRTLRMEAAGPHTGDRS